MSTNWPIRTQRTKIAIETVSKGTGKAYEDGCIFPGDGEFVTGLLLVRLGNADSSHRRVNPPWCSLITNDHQLTTPCDLHTAMGVFAIHDIQMLGAMVIAPSRPCLLFSMQPSAVSLESL